MATSTMMLVKWSALSLFALLPSATGYPCPYRGVHRIIGSTRYPSDAARSCTRRSTEPEPLISPPLALLATYGALPLAYSLLVDPILDVPALDTPRLLLLLVGKRVYLYALAALALDFASRRASEDYQADFGTRFARINECLFGIEIASEASKAADEIGLSKSVAEAPETSLALLLPVIVSSALIVSYLATTSSSGLLGGGQSEASSIISALLPLVTTLPVLGVCFSFCKAEIESVFKSSPVSTLHSYLGCVLTIHCLKAAAALAAGLVAAAFLLPVSYAWPAQNLINLAVISVVSQLVQFSQLPTILVALLGLTVYDFFAVFGTAHAAESLSVMETVARSRLPAASGSIPWLPGLLEVVVKGRVTDGLGLGDVVFPAMLAGWAMRHDRNNSSTRDAALYPSVVGGYIIGCLLCEVFQTGGGLPALVYLSPSMIVGLGLGKAREMIRAR